MAKCRILIIGGGAAGFAAGIAAAKQADVTIVEHKEEPLKKLLLTGNGRCNFSNTGMTPEHFHGDRRIVENVLKGFSVDDCLDFMNECGIEPLEVHYRFDGNGYFYPSTNRASTVRDALMKRFSDLGGRTVTGERVLSLKKVSGCFTVETDRQLISADRIIFACGSNAAPETGSDSSIYPVLMSLGVSFHTYLPALTGITTEDIPDAAKGARCEADVVLAGIDDGKEYGTETGEVQFGRNYVSGIPVMQLSRYVSIGKKEAREMKLTIYPVKWSNTSVSPEDLPGIMELHCLGTRGFSFAQCCSGGVAAEDIVPETLEYRKEKGIYFAGEMIDIDGECGGYNLHFAFGSGKLAGEASVR